MSVSRRRFLKTGALTAVAVGCAPGLRAFGQKSRRPALDFEIPFEARRDAVFYYTRETFEPYVGGIFRGLRRGRPVELKLLSVTSYTPSVKTRIATKPSPPTSTFTLTFESDRPLSTLAHVYNLQHAGLGKFSLLMTEAVNPDGQVLYEAVFNHLA
jgi:hypothetical protein